MFLTPLVENQTINHILRGGIVLDTKQVFQKRYHEITIIDCLLWVVDGFNQEKKKTASVEDVYFISHMARASALRMFNKLKDEPLSSSDIMLDCRREGQKLFHIMIGHIE